LRRLHGVRDRAVDRPAELRVDRREPRPAADERTDPAAGVVRWLQRAADLRRAGPAAAHLLRTRPRPAPGGAPAWRGAGAGPREDRGHRHRAGSGRAAGGQAARRQPHPAAHRTRVREPGMSRREPNDRLDRPVMILAGGTGGHIFPGLAVATVLHARGVPVTWLGADGQMETRLVPQQGIALDTIPVSGLRGKGAATLLAAPMRVARAVLAAWKVLRARRPRAVLSFGGYAAGPGGFAAWLRGTPLVVHEQNRAAGFTNRVLSKLARRVLTGFPQTFPRREEHVGNPVRADIAAVAPPEERLPRHDGRMHLLVLGGSQGARALNDAVPRALATMAGTPVEVRHQCGSKLEDEAKTAYANAGVEGSIEPFIADMAEAYAWADLVVCRAG